MNFLIDNPLSPRVAVALRAAGHDAVHVLDYGMHAATDEAIFERAALESRMVVRPTRTSAPCWPSARRLRRP